MKKLCTQFWRTESGQSIAEYAVLLAVILVVVTGTVRVIGLHVHEIFADVQRAMSK